MKVTVEFKLKIPVTIVDDLYQYGEETVIQEIKDMIKREMTVKQIVKHLSEGFIHATE